LDFVPNFLVDGTKRMDGETWTRNDSAKISFENIYGSGAGEMVMVMVLGDGMGSFFFGCFVGT
jgi:hypothetical protein